MEKATRPAGKGRIRQSRCEKSPQANRGELRGVRNPVVLVRGRMGNGGPGRKTWVVKVWLGSLGNFSDGGGAWMRWVCDGCDGPRRFGRRNSGETLESGQWP